jgi:hypothetical protein
MGRPPIGTQAMTSTERSRRRRARLQADQPATKPADHATKAPGPARGDDSTEVTELRQRLAEVEADRDRRLGAQANTALKDENTTFKARIAALEADRVENATLKAENATLKAEVVKLKAAAATPHETSRPRTVADLLARKAQVTAAKKAKRAEAKAARLMAAAAERPDADVPTLLAENDTLNQQLKAARTRVRNLTQELRHTRQHFEGLAEKTGAMDFATESALAKCLHPESMDNATEADKDKAFKLFTAWKATNRKARRHQH